jgi:predicted nucleotidyltransferase
MNMGNNNESISEIYENLLGKILNDIRRYFDKNLVSVVLYGSLARGEVKRNSDIDLLIISENLPRSNPGDKKFL